MTKQEALLEVRRRSQAGEFRRAITSRVPRDAQLDEVTLECGHVIAALPALLDRDSTGINCYHCTDDWAVAAARGADR